MPVEQNERSENAISECGREHSKENVRIRFFCAVVTVCWVYRFHFLFHFFVFFIPIKRIHLVKHINIMVALVMKLLKITFLMADTWKNEIIIHVLFLPRKGSIGTEVFGCSVLFVWYLIFFSFGVFIDVKNWKKFDASNLTHHTNIKSYQFFPSKIEP